ncbi:MAG TPA: hypothetical protein VEZ14_06685 [Dehalococcoidia bacterium]|nr:hypothetical protein [Dehalococcoidia bacterium]
MDELLDGGERVIRRAPASCLAPLKPMGRGEMILTDRRLLWFSSPEVLNIPFSLWRANVAIALTDIDSVTNIGFLPTSPIRVHSQQGVYLFTLRAGTLLNPLYVWRSRSLSREWVGYLRNEVALAQQAHD